MSQLLHDALKSHLSNWESDLPQQWQTFLGSVDLNWAAIQPDARLDPALRDRLRPLRKGHQDPAAPRDSHVLRAFDGLASSAVRAVLLGQDPYPEFSMCTGRAFEPGDLVAWDDTTPNSLLPVLRFVASHRQPAATLPKGKTALLAAMRADPTLGGSPAALFARWHGEGVLSLNVGMTLSRFDKWHSPPIRPLIQPMHISLWQPFIIRLLQKLTARPSPKKLLIMAWGKVARNAVARANLSPARVLMVERPHPVTPEFRQHPNPFTEANDLLNGESLSSIDW